MPVSRQARHRPKIDWAGRRGNLATAVPQRAQRPGRRADPTAPKKKSPHRGLENFVNRSWWLVVRRGESLHHEKVAAGHRKPAGEVSEKDLRRSAGPVLIEEQVAVRRVVDDPVRGIGGHRADHKVARRKEGALRQAGENSCSRNIVSNAGAKSMTRSKLARPSGALKRMVSNPAPVTIVSTPTPPWWKSFGSHLQGVGADAAYQPVVAAQPDEIVVEVVAGGGVVRALPTPTKAVPVNGRVLDGQPAGNVEAVLIELMMRSMPAPKSMTTSPALSMK